MSEVENVGGRGLVCLVDGVRAAFGNRALLCEEGIEVKDFGKTAIYVAVGGKLCGALLFKSRLKPEALAEIARVRRNHVDRIVIMSGDAKKAVEETAADQIRTQFRGRTNFISLSGTGLLTFLCLKEK